MAAEFANTGGMHGVDGRLECGGSYDSGEFDWWVYFLLGGQVDIWGEEGEEQKEEGCCQCGGVGEGGGNG